MDLQQLRTLIHVVELGSLRKAADRLGIAQPALSRQVRLLEDELGGALFERHGRGMVATDLCRHVLVPAGEILDRVAAIRRLAKDDITTYVGRVRLGMTPTVSEILAVPLAERVRQEHPGLALSLSSAFSGHLLDWLKRDEIDCCVSYDPVETGMGVRTQPILRETLMLVANGKRSLDRTKPVSFSALSGLQLILPNPVHGLRQNIDSCASRIGLRLVPVIEVDSLKAMIDLVKADVGCAILPLAPIHADVRDGKLSIAPLLDPTPSRLVALTFPADRRITPATRYVAEVLRAIATSMVERRIWSGTLL